MGGASAPMPRKAAWNVASWLATAVYGFAVTRLVVLNVGDAGYGLWATVGALRGFVLFLDGGLSLGVNRDSALAVEGDEEAAGRVRAGWRVYAGLALLAFVLFAAAAGFPGLLLDLTGDDAGVARALMVWFGVETAAALLTSPLCAILRGRQLFHALAAVNGAQTVLAVALLAVLTPLHGLEGAAWSVVAARGVVFVGAWLWMRAKGLLSSDAALPPGALRRVMVFAAPLWLAAVGTQLGGGTDVPIVGAVYGADAAGHYALGAIIPGVGAGMLFALMGTFFPRLVSVSGAEKHHLTGALIFMATFLAALGFGFIALHEDSLLLLWVGRAPGLALDVARIFALCWTLNAVTHVLSSMAIARGVHRVVGAVVFVEAAANVGVSLALAVYVSAIGPALGTLAIMLVTNVFVLPALLRPRLDLTWSEILRPAVWGYLLGALCAAAVALCVLAAGGGALVTVVVGVGLTGLAAGAALDLTVRGQSLLRRLWRITRRGGWSVWRRQRAEVARERAKRAAGEAGGPVVISRSAPPLVTVTIPTYNRGPLIAERAIASALAQTHENLEVVVVGDCCDDATRDAVLAVRDPRVRFENLAERGDYGSVPHLSWMVAGTAPRLRAIELARGEWIAPQDDDDEWTPDHVEALLDACRSRDLEFAYGIADMEAADGTWSPRGAWPPREGRIIHSALIYSARLRHVVYDIEAWKVDEPGDWNLWRRFHAMGVRMGFVEHVVTRHFAERRHLAVRAPWWLGRR